MLQGVLTKVIPVERFFKRRILFADGANSDISAATAWPFSVKKLVAVNPFWVDLDRYQREPGASVARAIIVRNVVTNRSGTDPRKFDIGLSVPQEVLNGPLVALRYEMIAAHAEIPGGLGRPPYLKAPLLLPPGAELVIDSDVHQVNVSVAADELVAGGKTSD